MRYSILPLMLTGLLAATPVLADWNLDPARSAVTYVTIKAKDVAENNRFQEMRGHIDAEGLAVVTLMLDSVETLVPIRNERMREFLFETSNYKMAEIRAKVDPAVIGALEVGEVVRIAAEANLTLHGQTQPMPLSMMAAKLDAGTLMVATTEPLLVDASKFGLSEGVEKLREIAGLASISEAVPVVFVVTFVETSGQ
ncbi:YceI family protein [Thiocystis violacea]|uniref:YceI family protein n=1 Tax=Thiocystis violacea TaxID=13725 RepID=UPI0019055FFF|nr:YceI family protein [Thiocystis violacea]MBK1719790.1 polyisoprenoid-binding protein [Thiocystis violacea]